MKKIISAFLACAVMALSLAGCGGSASSSAPAAGSASSAGGSTAGTATTRILVDGPAKHGVQSSEILFGTQGLAAL